MNTETKNETPADAKPVVAAEPCPNCKETIEQCACMRNICHKCGKPVGNITFTICDDCWDMDAICSGEGIGGELITRDDFGCVLYNAH